MLVSFGRRGRTGEGATERDATERCCCRTARAEAEQARKRAERKLERGSWIVSKSEQVGGGKTTRWKRKRDRDRETCDRQEAERRKGDSELPGDLEDLQARRDEGSSGQWESEDGKGGRRRDRREESGTNDRDVIRGAEDFSSAKKGGVRMRRGGSMGERRESKKREAGGEDKATDLISHTLTLSISLSLTTNVSSLQPFCFSRWRTRLESETTIRRS